MFLRFSLLLIITIPACAEARAFSTIGSASIADIATPTPEVVASAGFESSDDWRTDSWSRVHVEAIGDRDPGVGVISSDAFCLGSWLEQDIETPDEPSVVSARYRADGPSGMVLAAVEFSGHRVLEAVAGQGWDTARACIGDAGAGATTLAVGSDYHDYACDGTRSGLWFDFVDVEPATPADRCPAVGEVFASAQGIELHQTGSEDLEMNDQGSGFEISSPSSCANGWAVSRASIPLADNLSNPAIKIRFGDTSFDHVKLYQRQPGRAPGEVHTWIPGDMSEAGRTVVVCAGDNAGVVVDVMLMPRRAEFNCFPGSDQTTNLLTVESVDLVSAPLACP